MQTLFIYLVNYIILILGIFLFQSSFLIFRIRFWEQLKLWLIGLILKRILLYSPRLFKCSKLGSILKNFNHLILALFNSLNRLSTCTFNLSATLWQWELRVMLSGIFEIFSIITYAGFCIVFQTCGTIYQTTQNTH